MPKGERFNPAYKDLLRPVSERILPSLAQPLTSEEVQMHAVAPIRLVPPAIALEAQTAYLLSGWKAFEKYKYNTPTREDLSLIAQINTGVLVGGDEKTAYETREGRWMQYPDSIKPEVGSMGHVMIYAVDSLGEALSPVQALGYYNSDDAEATVGVLRTIHNRLKTFPRNTIQDVVNAKSISGKLAAVRFSDDKDRTRVVDTFEEGFVSIAHAHSQITVDMQARGIDVDEATMRKMITVYTKELPYGGVIAPMALRGDYFVGLFTAEGQISQKYVDFFRAEREGGDKYVSSTAPNAGEGCPAIGSVLTACTDIYFSLFDQMNKTKHPNVCIAIGAEDAIKTHWGELWD